MITLGSLFDGIGGWQLAAVKNGVKPLWSSEIDPFPASITVRESSLSQVLENGGGYAQVLFEPESMRGDT